MPPVQPVSPRDHPRRKEKVGGQLYWPFRYSPRTIRGGRKSELRRAEKPAGLDHHRQSIYGCNRISCVGVKKLDSNHGHFHHSWSNFMPQGCVPQYQRFAGASSSSSHSFVASCNPLLAEHLHTPFEGRHSGVGPGSSGGRGRRASWSGGGEREGGQTAGGGD